MARRRRGRFEGSIYQRSRTRKDGTVYSRWCAFESVRFEDGSRRRVTASDENKKLAIEKGQARKAEACERKAKPEVHSVAFSGFLTRWLHQHVKHEVEQTTFIAYESLLRVHVLPQINGLTVGQVKPATINELFEQLRLAGASARILRATYTLLNQAFSYGSRFGMLTFNPCAMIKRPRYTARPIKPLTKEQSEQLLRASRNSRIGALLTVALTCGLRQGELFALKWSDVHDNGTLSVQRQLRDISGAVSIVERTKSGKNRQVALSRTAHEALEKHRLEMQAEDHQSSDQLIFTDCQGGPLRKRNFMRRQFYPLLKRTGLPRIRFHDLRHTFATLCFEQGVHPKIVSEMLGHSTISITLDTYSAWIPSLGSKAANAMDLLFGPRP